MVVPDYEHGDEHTRRVYTMVGIIVAALVAVAVLWSVFVFGRIA